MIERGIARDFMVKAEHIHYLRVGFMEDGGVWIFGNEERGGAAEGAMVGKGTKMTT